MGRDALRSARRDAGMTQQQVAERLGITTRYYGMLEQGSRKGDFEIWDALEDMFSIHQRKLREVSERQNDR